MDTSLEVSGGAIRGFEGGDLALEGVEVFLDRVVIVTVDNSNSTSELDDLGVWGGLEVGLKFGIKHWEGVR